MKFGLLVFALAVFTTASAVAQQVPQKPQTLAVFPAQNPKLVVPNGLYLVTVTCRVSALPEEKVNVFEKKVRESALTITLSNSHVGVNEAPPAASVLAAIPVFGITISTSPPPSIFKNSGCNQSLLVTGRTPLYLTAVWTDQQSFTPSQLTQAISAIAGLAAPLGVLFPGGAANLLKTDTNIATSMSAPFSQLVAATNWSATNTETSAELRETIYTVAAKYFTKTFVTGAGTLSAAANVSIAVKQISSIKDALSVQAINSAFESSLQTFAAQIQKDPTTCIAIGRTLELNQNLTHADAVYALARIVVYSAIPSNKVTTCLGKTYGPEVIQDSFWKQNSRMTLTADEFPELQNVAPPFSPPIFDQIASAMTKYVAGKHNNVEVDRYFASKIIVNDATPLIGSSSESTMEQILDSLKATSGQYLYYGCPKSDTAPDANGVQDVGYVLAIDKSLKPENMVVMRLWWKLDQTNNPQPHIYQISLGSEGDVVKATLSADNNQCGLGVKIPTN